jgi:hypothetical protein
MEIFNGALYAMERPEHSIHKIRRHFHRAVCHGNEVGLGFFEPVPALFV